MTGSMTGSLRDRLTALLRDWTWPQSWQVLRLLVALAACWALLELPLSPGSVPRPRMAEGVCLDAVVLVGLIVLLGRALRRGRWALVLAGGALWALLVVFEMARSGTLHATNNDLPLYDAVLLAHHLYILGRDLYGGWATAGLLGLLLTPLVLWAFASALLGWIVRVARELARPWLAALLGVLLLVGVVSEAKDHGTRFLLPIALDNAMRSLSLWREVRQEIEKGPRPELLRATLPVEPDVVFYIVESYGQIVQTRPEMKAQWEPAVDQLQARVETAGWHEVSGLSVAPVHGGRSWIADASLLMGVKVEHEATYEHLMTLTDELPHLPRFFADRGYTTVLVKPKDRARPGVRLENQFAFHETLFADDLDYRGPFYGWGEIPDQFAIDRVEEEVLAPLEGPAFAFFHLVTSHMPWKPAPPLLADWREWQTQAGLRQPVFMERSFENEMRMRFSRWKRTLREDKIYRPPTDEQPGLYVENVLYDLEAVVQRLEKGVRTPRLVVLMGDHQPPLVAPGSGPEVIVHVLASDPRWLEEFREHGFVDGMKPAAAPPGPGPGKLAHWDLFPVLIEALLR
jgi:hypothetical protein